MKKKYIFAALAALLLGTSSCGDDFLNEKNPSQYSPESITDENGVEAALKGLYYVYGGLWTETGHQGWLSCWQIGTDVASAGQIQGAEIPYYQYGQLQANDWGASFTWETLYKLINNANNVIAILQGEGIALDEAAQTRSIAEARFFRGFAYNMLATLYGGVPLTTEPLSQPKTDFTRASLEEVNTQVEEDLRFAMENLPEIGEAKEESRANRYMAMQALGEAYLRMGRPADAEAPLKAIINSGKFALVKARYGTQAGEPGDFFHDMFIYGNQRRSQGNTETIWTFEVENPTDVPNGEIGSSQARRVWVPAYHDIKDGNAAGMLICDSLGGRGLGRLRLSYWMAHTLYETGDIRNSQYNIHRDFYYNNPAAPNYGKLATPAPADTIYKNMPYCTKWNCFDSRNEYGWNAVKDWELMRLGETYLLLAEAYQQQGKNQEAADAVNVLRERAFADYPTRGKVSASDMSLDFILDERARELIGEENRRLTLMRTKKLVDRAKLNTDQCYPITGLDEHHMLLPIPLTEIQLNKDAVLEQNPGYTN